MGIKIIEEKVGYARNAELSPSWCKTNGGSVELMTAKLPHDCRISGRIYGPGGSAPVLPDDYQGSSTFKVDWVQVSPEMRGHRIGSKLLLEAAKLARDRGASYLYGQVVNVEAAKSYGRAFQEDNIKILEPTKDRNELKFSD
jgi:GNAT superfamily N-acetyltransferase